MFKGLFSSKMRYLSAMIMEYVCNSGHSDSGDILARTSFSKYREPA